MLIVHELTKIAITTFNIIFGSGLPGYHTLMTTPNVNVESGVLTSSDCRRHRIISAAEKVKSWKSGENHYSLGIITFRVKMKESLATVCHFQQVWQLKSSSGLGFHHFGPLFLFHSVNRRLVGRIAHDYCCSLSVDVSLDGKNYFTWWFTCKNCSCFESCPELGIHI